VEAPDIQVHNMFIPILLMQVPRARDQLLLSREGPFIPITVAKVPEVAMLQILFVFVER
jgi:hypothetical protein